MGSCIVCVGNEACELWGIESGGEAKLEACCGEKFVDRDKLVLVEGGVAEVPGDIGDMEAEIDEYDRSIDA